MADAVCMAIVERLHDLEEDCPSLLLWKVALLDYTIEEFPTFAYPLNIDNFLDNILHHQVHIALILECLV